MPKRYSCFFERLKRIGVNGGLSVQFSMEECPACALEVRRGESVCPYCAYEFPTQPASRIWMAWVMAALLAWPVFELIGLLFD